MHARRTSMHDEASPRTAVPSTCTSTATATAALLLKAGPRRRRPRRRWRAQHRPRRRRRRPRPRRGRRPARHRGRRRGSGRVAGLRRCVGDEAAVAGGGGVRRGHGSDARGVVASRRWGGYETGPGKQTRQVFKLPGKCFLSSASLGGWAHGGGRPGSWKLPGSKGKYLHSPGIQTSGFFGAGEAWEWDTPCRAVPTRPAFVPQTTFRQDPAERLALSPACKATRTSHRTIRFLISWERPAGAAAKTQAKMTNPRPSPTLKNRFPGNGRRRWIDGSSKAARRCAPNCELTVLTSTPSPWSVNALSFIPRPLRAAPQHILRLGAGCCCPRVQRAPSPIVPLCEDGQAPSSADAKPSTVPRRRTGAMSQCNQGDRNCRQHEVAKERERERANEDTLRFLREAPGLAAPCLQGAQYAFATPSAARQPRTVASHVTAGFATNAHPPS